MGITGLFKELGPGTRTSLAALSAAHYTTHARPLRLAIDISIWLFQIQSGKGGSNPALRTFYYRLLRLLTLNIHPFFVFDGPNKPEWKRGKRVGGPGVRVASVPEFLAKQLLKQLGFPWHVAPGEAEAECAVLQREGVVDAVLSEDVDTLMFGSGVTLRNWSAEGSTKTPTHVSVYREEETLAKSGLDREGMVLVALMSGGDYIPTGIAGCGPKLACDAARAGYGGRLCKLKRRDADGMRQWREELEHEVRTNSSKHFSRKNTRFTIPGDFPNWEVLGYYTHPCVSTAEKIRQMKETVKWDQSIDFAALRSFTADAFDWRCIGGAKKFIKNLAPGMLVRELRLKASQPDAPNEIAQEERELAMVHAVHGKRNHFSADNELEYRISFTPANLVPIDLSIEDEDDQFNPAGGNGIDSDAESDFLMIPSSTPVPDEEPATPSKKRTFKPYHPDQPEKLWLLRPFLQLGCPLLVETYETPIEDPKEFLKARRKAKNAGKAASNIHGAAKSKKGKKAAASSVVQENALMQYARVTKSKETGRDALKELSQASDERPSSRQRKESAPSKTADVHVDDIVSAFKMPSTQLPSSTAPPQTTRPYTAFASTQPALHTTSTHSNPTRPFAPFAVPKRAAPTQQPAASQPQQRQQQQRTPSKPKSRKRRSPDLSSPAASQRTITSYYSPSPRKGNWVAETIDLVSSSPQRRARTPSLGDTRFKFSRTSGVDAQVDAGKGGLGEGDVELELPSSVTRRRRRGGLKRARTAPVVAADLDAQFDDDAGDVVATMLTPPFDTAAGDLFGGEAGRADNVIDITSSSPVRDTFGAGMGGGVAAADEEGDGDELPSPGFLFGRRSQLAGGFLREAEEGNGDETPRPARRTASLNASLHPLVPGSTSRNRDHAEDEAMIALTSAAKVDDWLHQDPHDELISGASAVQPSLSSPAAEDTQQDPPQPRKALPNVQRVSKPKAAAPPPSPLPRRSPRHSNTRPSPIPPQRSSDQTRPKPLPKPSKTKTKAKNLIIPRTSLVGAWKEVPVPADIEALDLTGDGSGWAAAGRRTGLVAVGGLKGDGGGGTPGRGMVRGFRKSGVEVLDLTGA